MITIPQKVMNFIQKVTTFRYRNVFSSSHSVEMAQDLCHVKFLPFGTLKTPLTWSSAMSLQNFSLYANCLHFVSFILLFVRYSSNLFLFFQIGWRRYCCSILSWWKVDCSHPTFSHYHVGQTSPPTKRQRQMQWKRQRRIKRQRPKKTRWPNIPQTKPMANQKKTLPSNGITDMCCVHMKSKDKRQTTLGADLKKRVIHTSRQSPVGNI